jgi:hypothetical protein
MIGGDKEQAQSAGSTFANYTDDELFAELGRLADELGIEMTLSIEPNEGGEPDLRLPKPDR